MCRNGSACGCGGGGSGVPAILAIPVILVTALTVFAAAHVLIVGLALGVFLGAVGGFAVWTRRFRRLPVQQRVTVTRRRARAARAVTGPRKAITAGRGLSSLAAPARPATAIARSLQPTSPPDPSPSPGSPAAAP